MSVVSLIDRLSYMRSSLVAQRLRPFDPLRMRETQQRYIKSNKHVQSDKQGCDDLFARAYMEIADYPALHELFISSCQTRRRIRYYGSASIYSLILHLASSPNLIVIYSPSMMVQDLVQPLECAASPQPSHGISCYLPGRLDRHHLQRTVARSYGTRTSHTQPVT